ncbi:MAG: branched-chain amino acid ABC transporter permease [Phycisphaeraceae bacterium]|nr:branched-chain amino acid ABC transporter permease [Phycisphaeraceae bacterium]
MSNLLAQSRALAPTTWTVVLRALWPFLLGIAVGLFAYFYAGPELGGYHAQIARVAGINVILAVSLTVVNGFAGQFSMGHAGFMAVGGYVAAGITYYGTMRLVDPAQLSNGLFIGGLLSWTGIGQFEGPVLTWGDALFVGSCLVGGLAAAGAGYIVGLPSLRLKGDYLAIVTLGFGEIVRVLFQGTKDQIPPWQAETVRDIPWYDLMLRLGGPKGMNLLPTYTTLFWVYLFATLTLIFCYRLKVSSSGRALLAIREDEIAAQAMGVDITRYKVRAFVLSAFFAGVAGGLYAMDIGALNAGDLGFQKSFDIIIMVVLGGMGSISGAALAAIILTILPELLRSPPMVWPAGLALLIIVAAVQSARGRWRPRSLIVIAVVTAALEIGRRVAIANGINLADYRLVLYASLLITMMLARPQGLFGIHEIWEMIPRRRPQTAGADE